MGMTLGWFVPVVDLVPMLSYEFSWVLAYNLYADKLLGTNVFPDTVYSMRESSFSFTSPFSSLLIE